MKSAIIFAELAKDSRYEIAEVLPSPPEIDYAAITPLPPTRHELAAAIDYFAPDRRRHFICTIRLLPPGHSC